MLRVCITIRLIVIASMIEFFVKIVQQSTKIGTGLKLFEKTIGSSFCYGQKDNLRRTKQKGRKGMTKRGSSCLAFI